MKHNRQRKDECGLCAVCTATEIDYGRQSDMFEMDHGYTFGEAMVRNPLHPAAFGLMSQLLGFDANKLRRVNYRTVCRSSYRSRVGLNDLTDLRGKGIMVFRNVMMQVKHAVAYHNGVIYDGNAPYQLWFGDYVNVLRANALTNGMYHVLTIIPTGKGSE